MRTVWIPGSHVRGLEEGESPCMVQVFVHVRGSKLIWNVHDINRMLKTGSLGSTTCAQQRSVRRIPWITLSKAASFHEAVVA